MIFVRLEPESEDLTLPKPNTVLQLLNRLQLGRTQALVIRSGELLTPDRRIHDGDRIEIRKVTSAG
ncbi:MAG: sulfur carrier protein [Desulfovibrionales bacterium]|jgi:sulfur carrier protein|nr:sulfur carrier protein [Desulfovibrionales bacterium]